MVSTTNSLYDIAGMFCEVESPDFLGNARRWIAISHPQEEFLPLLKASINFARELKAEGLIHPKASWEARGLNDWYAKHNCPVSLTDLHKDDGFYLGSICQRHVEWGRPGFAGALKGKNGVFYHGVKMKNGVDYFHTDYTGEVVVRIAMKSSQDAAYMMMMDRPPMTGVFPLLMFADQVQRHLVRTNGIEYVHFPMVGIQREVVLPWLANMWTQKDVTFKKVTLLDARMFVDFQLSEKGDTGNPSGGQVSTSSASTRRDPLMINRPFLFWISRENYPLPLFAAHINYPDWKNQSGAS